MIGNHLQNSPPNWPDAIRRYQAGTPVKMVTALERCREAKQNNPDCITWYRWVGPQPLPASNFEAHARNWLNNFVDGTFRQHAEHIDFIQEYNETFANSQSASEKANWIALHTAMAKVWHEEYRKEPGLEHIRMILAETAIGNDIPIEVAWAAVKYDGALGYHPYIVCRVGQKASQIMSELEFVGDVRHDAPRAAFRPWIVGSDNEAGKRTIVPAIMEDYLYKMDHTWYPNDDEAIPDLNRLVISRPDYVSPHDWRWYSGRWSYMDSEYAAAGVKPLWIFGEMGPVLDASQNWDGWLDPMGGWKHKDCLNGDIEKYKLVLKYWLDNTMGTQAYKEGRVLGGVLFTSGAPGSGPSWDHFDLVQPDMNTIADFVAGYDYKPTDPIDPPPPPIDPPPVVENLILNGSFESTNWKDFEGADIQEPEYWTIRPYSLGRQIRKNAAKIYQEIVHKDMIGDNPLPEDEWLGAENALILDGVRTLKAFGSQPSGMRMSQKFVAPKDGVIQFTLPAQIHFDGRDPEKYEADDTLLEVGIDGSSRNFWMAHEYDRKWLYHAIKKDVAAGDIVEVWLDFSFDWGHHTALFTDAAAVEYVDEPVEPPPPTIDPGLPREQYGRFVHVGRPDYTLAEWLELARIAYEDKQTVGFSYDDGGIGALAKKTVKLWDIPEAEKQKYLDWYATNYPGTNVLYGAQRDSTRHWPVLTDVGEFVDVSHWQGDIDWLKMKDAGVTHCYIKCTDGLHFEDPMCDANADGAESVNINHGYFHYYRNHQDGIAQAEKFVTTMLYGLFPLSPVVDIETGGQQSMDLNVTQLREFLDHVEIETGHLPVIYTSRVMWHEYFKEPQPWASRYPLWVADYRDRQDPELPRDWDKYWLWQYGQAPGDIYGASSSKIDVNRVP